MKKHRGWGLALAGAALIALGSQQAQASSVVITVTEGSNTVTISTANGAQFVEGGSTDQLFTVLTQTLNKQFTDISFSNLGVSSNSPGGATSGYLTLTGTLAATASPVGPVTITATLDNFTAPVGAGTLTSSSTANFTAASTGSESANSMLNSTSTAALMYTSTGTNPNSSSSSNSIGATTTSAGYTLVDTTTINLAGTGATNQFTVSANFVSSAVPEPASLVMMLTGMPLPLVVMGLLRRRRAAA